MSRRRASKPTPRRHQAGSRAATRHHRCPAQLRVSCFPRPRRGLLGHGYDFNPGWTAPSRPVRARDYSRVDDGGRVDELRDRHPSPSHVPPSITCECLRVTHRSHAGCGADAAVSLSLPAGPSQGPLRVPTCSASITCGTKPMRSQQLISHVIPRWRRGHQPVPLRRTQHHLRTLSGACFCVAFVALRVPGVLLSLKLVL